MGRVVHFEIHATDPVRASAFYSSVFGWTIQQWADQPYWLITTGTGVPGIDGAIVPRRGQPATQGGAVNAYVCTAEVDDLDAATDRAVAAGGRIAVPRSPVPGIGALAYVADPGENLLGILQPDASAG